MSTSHSTHGHGKLPEAENHLSKAAKTEKPGTYDGAPKDKPPKSADLEARVATLERQLTYLTKLYGWPDHVTETVNIRDSGDQNGYEPDDQAQA